MTDGFYVKADECWLASEDGKVLVKLPPARLTLVSVSPNGEIVASCTSPIGGTYNYVFTPIAPVRLKRIGRECEEE